jgi:fructokinase
MVLALLLMTQLPPAVVVGLGEVLWDVFSPSKRLLGGAPANFAYHAHCMGDNGVVASRVGSDELGAEALAILESRGVNTRYIQESSVRPTGRVMVTLAADGQPAYIIEKGAAWDELELSPEWDALAASADAVCYGSLAQRSSPSRETIVGFLARTRPSCVRVFDVNLRQSFYDAACLRAGLAAATIAKLNDEEAHPLLECAYPGAAAPASLEECAERLLAAHAGLMLVCITRGAKGVSLVSRGARVSSPSVSVEVADTIGAGDAFTAALVHSLLDKPLAEMTEASLAAAAVFASKYAAHVCSHAGAMPAPPAWLSKAK